MIRYGLAHKVRVGLLRRLLVAFLVLITGACAELTDGAVDPQAVDPTSSGVDLILVDAEADFQIKRVQTGDVIDVGRLGRALNLIAVPVANSGVKSAVFFLDGERARTENVAPYALAGDRGSDYFAWDLSLGEHSVNVLMFDGPNGAGNLILSAEASFTLVDVPPSAISTGVELILVDTDADLDLIEFEDDRFRSEDSVVVDTGEFGTALSVRANISALTSGDISVLFIVNGERARIENVSPYALGGDRKGDYEPWTLSAGENSVSALVFSGPNGAGNLILSAETTFTLTGE